MSLGTGKSPEKRPPTIGKIQRKNVATGWLYSKSAPCRVSRRPTTESSTCTRASPLNPRRSQPSSPTTSPSSRSTPRARSVSAVCSSISKVGMKSRIRGSPKRV